MTILMRKSAFAGFMIGIGAIVYTRCDNRYIGAFLFSFGLLSILNLGGYLYTGRIGYASLSKKSINDMLIILLFNIIGILFAALLTIDTTNVVFQVKLNNPLLHTFISSILCGVMMYLAVELYNKKSNPLYVIMAIMIFILSGFDHCIANVYYFAINPVPCITIRTIFFFIINILGNTMGSLFTRYIFKIK